MVMDTRAIAAIQTMLDRPRFGLAFWVALVGLMVFAAGATAEGKGDDAGGCGGAGQGVSIAGGVSGTDPGIAGVALGGRAESPGILAAGITVVADGADITAVGSALLCLAAVGLVRKLVTGAATVGSGILVANPSGLAPSASVGVLPGVLSELGFFTTTVCSAEAGPAEGVGERSPIVAGGWLGGAGYWLGGEVGIPGGSGAVTAATTSSAEFNLAMSLIDNGTVSLEPESGVCTPGFSAVPDDSFSLNESCATQRVCHEYD